MAVKELLYKVIYPKYYEKYAFVLAHGFCEHSKAKLDSFLTFTLCTQSFFRTNSTIQVPETLILYLFGQLKYEKTPSKISYYYKIAKKITSAMTAQSTQNSNIWVCLVNTLKYCCLVLGFYNFVPTATPQQGNQRRGLMYQYPTTSTQQPIWQKIFILYSTIANLTENLYSLFHNSQFDRKSLFQSPSFQLLLHSSQFDRKYLFFIPQ